jgi:hypothetical protein
LFNVSVDKNWCAGLCRVPIMTDSAVFLGLKRCGGKINFVSGVPG